MELDDLIRGALSRQGPQANSENAQDEVPEDIQALLAEIIQRDGSLPDGLAALLADQESQPGAKVGQAGKPKGIRLGLTDLLAEPSAQEKIVDLLRERLNLSPEMAESIAGSILTLLGEKPAKRKPRKKAAAKSKKSAKTASSARKKSTTSSGKKKAKGSSTAKKTKTSQASGKKKSAVSKTEKPAGASKKKKAGKSSTSKQDGASKAGKSKTAARTKKSTGAKSSE